MARTEFAAEFSIALLFFVGKFANKRLPINVKLTLMFAISNKIATQVNSEYIF